MILPSIINTAQICAELGIQRAIISPGSRNAPLTIAFVRHPKIQTYTVSDERSAAFIGLGMARQERRPVALICTSGSAAYNYTPTVAEAYFQRIPLLILTADRPPEWIDQLDGQTIRQREIYGRHVKASYELPVGQTESDQWYAGRIVSEAINEANANPPGPVHINVPIREPFYPEEGEEITFDQSVKVIRYTEGEVVLPAELLTQLRTEWQQYPRKLIVAGQSNLSSDLCQLTKDFSQNQQIPLVADVISNFHPVDSAVKHADAFLSRVSAPEQLQPDLLITFGLSVISKNLKLFLRKHQPKAHWHIQPRGVAADTFQSLSRVLRTTLEGFFQAANDWDKQPSNYYQTWQNQEEQTIKEIDSFVNLPENRSGEFYAVSAVLRNLPQSSSLHLANSMAVRYANLIGLPKGLSDVEVIANRGTSGIDGSNSTAVGASLVSLERLHVLITGDLAFFYDRNAFWHTYSVPNLRIILLNNHGGGIFRMINGPSRQPELEEYFETKQQLEAENTARDFGMDYFRIDMTLNDAPEELESLLPGFFTKDSKSAKLLEIISDSPTNAKIFRQFKARD